MADYINGELFDFIKLHQNEDPNSLRLRFHKDGAPKWIHIAINHIEALKKSGRKFEDLQPELMATPLSSEQASSATVARLHGSIAKAISSDASSFLDMTCGLGIDFRAISEELGHNCISTAIELNPDLAEAARYNFRNIHNIHIIEGDSVKFLENTPDHFDLVFIDPARRDRNGGRLYNIHDCQPDVGSLIPLFMRKTSHVMVKLSPMLDVKRTLTDLPCSELHVVDDGKECREVLAIMDFTKASAIRINPDQTPITIHSGGNAKPLTFNLLQERSASPFFAENPIPGQWLFEPSPSAMKAAPFALLSEKYGIRKLHRNTHLYIADTPIDYLPGKWYCINEVIPFSSSNIKHIARRKIKADVAVRNFPMMAEELAYRLKAAPGGNIRLIGATCANNVRLLISLKK